MIIQANVEEGGLCRFAVLPDGAVTADADGYGGQCPPATQDIQLNLTNRQNAIDNVGYGPLNPAEPNEEFWQDKADRWKTTIQEAKSAVCGNCIFFVRTPKMLDCIENGIGLGTQEAEGSIEAGELGYCNALDFKCASERTCNAWAAGGPVTEETVTATAGSKPAPKKDRIKGSSKNKPGSAKDKGGSITISAAVEKALQNKVKTHNEKAPEGRKATLRMLKAVYRRGAGAYSSSHRPDQTRGSWAMARVNAFLKLLKSGRPKNSKYVNDNDLLPAKHPRSTKSTTASGAPDLRARLEQAKALLAAAEQENTPGEAQKPTSTEIENTAITYRSVLNPKTQPRDDRGKFRKVLARLKQNLGEAGLQAVTEKVGEIENLEFAGNYVASNRAAGKLLTMVDRIGTEALNSDSLETVRNTSRELGRVIANTPLPFGDENAKLRFSDLPPAMKTLAQDMIKKVEATFGDEDQDEAAEAVKTVKNFMSGGDLLSQQEIQAELSKLLRLLT